MKEPEVPLGEHQVEVIMRFDVKALQSADLPYSLLTAKSCDLSSFTCTSHQPMWMFVMFDLFCVSTATQLEPLMCPSLPEMQIILCHLHFSCFSEFCIFG